MGQQPYSVTELSEIFPNCTNMSVLVLASAHAFSPGFCYARRSSENRDQHTFAWAILFCLGLGEFFDGTNPEHANAGAEIDAYPPELQPKKGQKRNVAKNLLDLACLPTEHVLHRARY